MATAGDKRINCPMCGESIAAAAPQCPFCGEELDASVGPDAAVAGGTQTLTKLRSIARSQRRLIPCILGQALLLVGCGVILAIFAGAPKKAHDGLLLGLGGCFVVSFGLALLVVVMQLVFGCRLVYLMHGVGDAIAMGFAMLIPVVSLIILMICYQDASAELKKHGYKVGFLGASMSQFRDESPPIGPPPPPIG